MKYQILVFIRGPNNPADGLTKSIKTGTLEHLMMTGKADFTIDQWVIRESAEEVGTKNEAKLSDLENIKSINYNITATDSKVELPKIETVSRSEFKILKKLHSQNRSPQ